MKVDARVNGKDDEDVFDGEVGVGSDNMVRTTHYILCCSFTFFWLRVVILQYLQSCTLQNYGNIFTPDY